MHVFSFTKKIKRMLITKFNRMIRNKLLWAGFAVLISIAFVGFLGPQGGRGNGRPQSGMAGRLNNENISREEFFMARFFEAGMGNIGSLAPEESEMLHKRAWKRLAIMQAAKSMAILASDDEVREAIQHDPIFSVNGVFNKDRYKGVLAQSKVNPGIYESYLRQEVTMFKLASVLESLIWTSPRELAEKLSKLPISQANTRAFSRLMLAGAMDVDIDKQGRMVLPEYLRDYAGLNKKVVVAGLFNRLEIWDSESWKNYKKDTENKSEDISEKLGELGV